MEILRIFFDITQVFWTWVQAFCWLTMLSAVTNYLLKRVHSTFIQEKNMNLDKALDDCNNWITVLHYNKEQEKLAPPAPGEGKESLNVDFSERKIGNLKQALDE